jgi:hypothetical protein
MYHFTSCYLIDSNSCINLCIVFYCLTNSIGEANRKKLFFPRDQYLIRIIYLSDTNSGSGEDCLGRPGLGPARDSSLERRK